MRQILFQSGFFQTDACDHVNAYIPGCFGCSHRDSAWKSPYYKQARHLRNEGGNEGEIGANEADVLRECATPLSRCDYVRVR
jgi:hypothetical protein